MPNQNNNDPNKPTNQLPNQPASPSVFPQSDLPPLPPAFQDVSPGTATPPETPKPVSAAPLDNLPPVISSSPKKKFGGGRIIATILGILLLIGGVGAGLLLTQQRQLFQQKAGSGTAYCSEFNTQDCQSGCTPDANGGHCTQTCLPNGSGCYQHNVPLGGACTTSEDCGGGNGCWNGSCQTEAPINLQNDPNNCGALGHKCLNGYECTSGACVASSSTSCKVNDIGAPVCCTRPCEGQPVCEGQNRLECNTGGQHCTIDANGCTNGSPPPEPPRTSNPPSAPPSTPPNAPQCLNVKAYKLPIAPRATPVALTPAELSALKPNDIVAFCVTGSAASGTFDKAMFKINSTVEPETTNQFITGSFCQQYTILSTDTKIDVFAKIHHDTGWVGETF